MSINEPPTLTHRVRTLTGGLLAAIGTFLHRLGIHPDVVSLLGLILVAVAAVFIAIGQFQIAGVILLVGLPLDAIDGAVAKAMQRTSRFGECLDSSLDRYADGFIFAALSYYFAVEDRFTLMLLAMTALLGSYMVSYIRARADGVDVSVKIGVFTRMERLTVILVMLLIAINGVMEAGLWLLAIGTHFTALQRLWFVNRTLHQREIERD